MRRAFFVLVVGTALVGCRSNSFVGRSYDNFTAYYNTFYNARQAYDVAVKPLEERTGPIDATRYLGLFPTPAQGNARAFDDVVKQSADVLREHASSKWADDALLLIGKSYYYQRNLVGAEQKFNEVIALGGPLRDEAEFWLARTRLAQTDYDGAASAVQEALAREELHRRARARLQLVLAEVAVQREDWAQAEQDLTDALPNVRDGDLAARSWFLLGQVRETIGQYASAAEAYAQAVREKPVYDLSYAAQVGQARALIAADADAALSYLRRMERDGKNFSNLAEIALLRARALQALGRVDDAYEAYHDLLYYGEVAPGNQRGAAHYHLATFYREVDRNFALAAAHFDTAATALTAPPADLIATPWAVRDGRETADVFGTFRDVAARIAERDSLLYLADLPPAAFDSTIAAIRAQLVEDELVRREAEARAAREAAFSTNANTTLGPGGRTPQRRNPNAPPRAGATTNNPDGFLSHRNPALVAQGRQQFFTTWGERPLVPNWRRREALTGANTEFPQDAATDPTNSPTAALAPDVVTVQLDLSAIPRDSLSRAEMLTLRAADRYELGNVLFLAMNRPDSAAYWYRRVVEEDEGAPVQPQALYALAEVQRALSDSLAAAGLYQQLLDRYPEAEFADRVRGRLGLPPLARAAVDSLAMAEAQYATAYARWQEGAFREAMESLFETALAYRETTVAPQAMLAAAHAFVEWAQADSLDLYAAYPITITPDATPPRVALPDTMAPYMPPIDTTIQAMVPLTFGEEAADSLAAIGPDSLGVGAMPDSSQTGGAEITVTDPIRAPFPGPMEAVAEPDSAAVPVDTPVAPADTLVPQPLRLDALYASIVAHYPNTPFAEKAQVLGEMFEAARPVPPSVAADSLSTLDSLAVDSLVVDSLAVADSVLVPVPDSLSAAPNRAEAEGTRPAEAAANVLPLQDALVAAGEVPPLPAPLSGEAASELDAAAGGLTWVVLSTRDADVAAAYAERLRSRGYPASALPGMLDGDSVFRVGVGHFEDQEAATFARRYYPPNFPLSAWLYRIGSDE